MARVFLDYRFYSLLIALLMMIWGFIKPDALAQQPIYNLTVIVDITRSMNAADYQYDDKAVSRLQFVKHSLGELLATLPCQSKVSLGVFTERRSTLLFQPIEVCSGFNEIETTLAALDWRMAWAADSRIAQGLKQTLDSLKNSDTRLVFMTDGQEAPPVNPRYAVDFAALKTKTKGLIIGVGGLQAVPIPKFNEKGESIGVYSADDVPHRSSFGESNLNPETLEGYDARNAPFGKVAVTGTEHLTALQESYLQQIAGILGFHYARLTDTGSLKKALVDAHITTLKTVPVDRRWQFATLALSLLLLIYLLPLCQHLYCFTRFRLTKWYEKNDRSQTDLAV
jgi:mxaL protein